MSPLDGKTIVLGVSGGIAAYKAAELVRLLVNAGANVRVMMTRNATEFITPLTLQTLSANPVATDTFSLTQESEIGHIRLADSADAIVIAPATADMIAKAAVGYRRRHRDHRAARDARESRVCARDERAHVRASDGRRESREAARRAAR